MVFQFFYYFKFNDFGIVIFTKNHAYSSCINLFGKKISLRNVAHKMQKIIDLFQM
jgi:hypothetical protein